MRLLVTSFRFPPQADGVSEIARAQALGLARRGFDVTVATGFDPGRSEEAMENVRIRQFKIDWTAKGSFAGDLRGYQQFIATQDADIILCNCWQNWATDLALQVFGRVRARKVILSQGFDAHLWHPHWRFAWGVGQWLRARKYVRQLPSMLRAFDHLIFLSEQRDRRRFYDHFLAQRLGINSRSVLPNGVWLGELEKRQPDFRKEYGIQNRYLLLNVANYCDRKNQLAALRAFSKLRRSDVTMVFIGSQFNGYSEEMKRLLRKNPNQNVFMLQQLPRPVIYSAYQSADLFLLPSKDETQPLALLEAMACGVPFVSTPVGCVREFPGGLIAVTEAEFVGAINDLLNKSEQRRTLGEVGRRAVRDNYSWESIIGKYELLFSDLMRGEYSAPASGRRPQGTHEK